MEWNETQRTLQSYELAMPTEWNVGGVFDRLRARVSTLTGMREGRQVGARSNRRSRIGTRFKPHLEGCIGRDVKPIVLSLAPAKLNGVRITLTRIRMGDESEARTWRSE